MPGSKKECPMCKEQSAIAKKVCGCGHVFLVKKKRGFQESPIVIKSERLRHSYVNFDGRPVRIKKPSYHGDFVYTVTKSKESPDGMSSMISEEMKETEFNNTKQTDGNNESEFLKLDAFTSEILGDIVPHKIEDDSSQSSTTSEYYNVSGVTEGNEAVLVEKLYPKRDRTKTSRYENSKYKDMSKQSKRVHTGNDFPSQTSTIKKWKKNSTEENILESEFNKDTYRKPELCINKPEGKTSSSVCINDSSLLVKDIDATIDILTVKNNGNVRHPSDNSRGGAITDGGSENESIYTEDGEKLELVKIPKDIEGYLNDCSTGKRARNVMKLLDKKHNNNKWNMTGDTSKVKRPVGRPRKHPIVINKVKRPVGRPRKKSTEFEGSLVEVNGYTRKRIVMYADQYYRESDFDDAFDDEADPDYKSPKNSNAPSLNRPDRPGRRCFLSPPQLIASAKMERIRNEMLENVEAERLEKKLTKKHAFDIPPEKRELYSHILEEINRRILAQAFNQ